jgi:hypothetical protein
MVYYEPQELKIAIEQDILNDERIINNKIIHQESVDILEIASELMNYLTSKSEVFFMYKILYTRLYQAGMVCKTWRNRDLGKRLILIAQVIKEVLANYLVFPKRVLKKETIILKIWPHDCKNTKIFNDVLRKYIVENATLLRCYRELVIDFLKQFYGEIGKVLKANDLKLLRYEYEKIRDVANENARQRFMRGLDDAWQYGIIELVIEFMFSDFWHCFRSPEYRDDEIEW